MQAEVGVFLPSLLRAACQKGAKIVAIAAAVRCYGFSVVVLLIAALISDSI